MQTRRLPSPLLALGFGDDLAWPFSTRFGLAGAVAVSQWCVYRGPGPDAELFVRGGAGECHPWEGCGEWLWMVNGCIVPQAWRSADAASHAVRPVIRLAAP